MTNKTAVGKTTKASSKDTVVNYGTTKQKVDYIPAGVAEPTKDRKHIIVYLKNGEKLIISKPVSDKQLNYFKETTAEKYVDHNDTNRIYMYSAYVVKHIKVTDYNEDLQASHSSENTPKKENNVEQQSKAMRETSKKATAKTRAKVNKELNKQLKEEEEAAEEAASNSTKKGGKQ